MASLHVRVCACFSARAGSQEFERAAGPRHRDPDTRVFLYRTFVTISFLYSNRWVCFALRARARGPPARSKPTSLDLGELTYTPCGLRTGGDGLFHLL